MHLKFFYIYLMFENTTEEEIFCQLWSMLAPSYYYYLSCMLGNITCVYHLSCDHKSHNEHVLDKKVHIKIIHDCGRRSWSSYVTKKSRFFFCILQKKSIEPYLFILYKYYILWKMWTWPFLSSRYELVVIYEEGIITLDNHEAYTCNICFNFWQHSCTNGEWDERGKGWCLL